MFKYLLGFFCLLFIACAVVVAPSGGPVDKLPPRLKGISIAPNSTEQSLNLDITMQFDEWIEQKPPMGAIVISPPIMGRLLLKADGDRLRVFSNEPLDSNTTYTLTITNAIRDLRQNSMENPFTLLFSTGVNLDSLKTDFTVLMQDSLIKRKKFPIVGFYPIGKERATKGYLAKYRDSLLTAETDTFPNITKEIPLYLAQADSNGMGTLLGMKEGNYLAAAFLDQNNDRRINVETEMVGIAKFPFELKQEQERLFFSLGDLDTSSVKMDAASQRGNREIELSFSRDVVLDSAFKVKDNCSISSGATDTLYSENAYLEARSKNIILFVNGLKNDLNYTVKCKYAADSSGRLLDTAIASAKFLYKKMEDTLATSISIVEPFSNSSNIMPGAPIKLSYSRSIDLDSIASNFRLFVNEDSVEIKITQTDAIRFEIESVPPWGADSKIKLARIDSTMETESKQRIVTQFSTISKLKFASLKGEIPGGNEQTVVVLKESVSKGTAKEFTAKCDAKGAFEFPNLLEGIYKLLYFRDINGDGKLTSGSVFPLRAGEPWVMPPEDLILPTGNDNILSELIKDLPPLPNE